MASITPLSRHVSSDSNQERLRRRRDEAESLRTSAASKRAGFSARLNMLCGLAGERDLADGRLEDLLALNPDWDAASVRAWLTDDIVPSAADLDLLARFLTNRVTGDANHRLWEAFILYGAEHVENPLHKLLDPQGLALLDLASKTLLQITREYRVPPHAYDADLVLREIMHVLRDLNISPADTHIQPGHQLMLANRLFPDYVRQ